MAHLAFGRAGGPLAVSGGLQLGGALKGDLGDYAGVYGDI